MFVGLIRFLWLILLVMALPLQASSHVKISTDSSFSTTSLLSTTSALATKATQWDTNFSFSSLADDSELPLHAPVQPVTQTFDNTQALGILSSLRWNHFQRHLDEHEPSEPFSTLEQILAQHTALARVLSSGELYNWLCRDCTAKYRLSGWKESNAMYVALNGHY